MLFLKYISGKWPPAITTDIDIQPPIQNLPVDIYLENHTYQSLNHLKSYTANTFPINQNNSLIQLFNLHLDLSITFVYCSNSEFNLLAKPYQWNSKKHTKLNYFSLLPALYWNHCVLCELLNDLLTDLPCSTCVSLQIIFFTQQSECSFISITIYSQLSDEMVWWFPIQKGRKKEERGKKEGNKEEREERKKWRKGENIKTQNSIDTGPTPPPSLTS